MVIFAPAIVLSSRILLSHNLFGWKEQPLKSTLNKLVLNKLVLDKLASDKLALDKSVFS